MTNTYSVLGIIPARGGSKGVTRKNIRRLAGYPLIAYTIDAARKSRLLTKYVVSTEDAEIVACAQASTAEVIIRPADLSEDATPILSVLFHVIEALLAEGESYDYTLLLQPTTPLRTAQDIDNSLELLISSGAESVVSVTPVPGHYHPDWQFTIENESLKLYNGRDLSEIVPRRQMLSPTYTRNGAIYAVRTEFLLNHHSLFCPKTLAYVMPAERSINIDDELDLRLAELLMMQKKMGAPPND